MTLHAQPRDSIDSLDEMLGPAQGRYFGAGFREVGSTLDVTSNINGDLSAVAHLSYPESWSIDSAGRPRRAHVSSIDAIVLSLQLVDLLSPELDTLENSRLRVASVLLRAGAEPWYDIKCVPVTLSGEHRIGGYTVQGRVGGVKVAIQLEASENSFVGSADEHIAHAPNVYRELFKQTLTATDVVALDLQRGELHAKHRWSHSAGDTAPVGVGAAGWPSPTIIDYLVTMGQLTQALVYAVSGTNRATAGPLWMRSMSIVTQNNSTLARDSFSTATRIVHDRTFERGDQRVHDVAVQSQSTDGAHATSTLAYTEGLR